ncbi:unnamed protein product [Dicrocoelium dendriticum]|nr:unnamed protein product [Dicrocoelium dendriticum]
MTCTAITAAAHKRRCGEELPSGCTYKFIQYRCVHSKRSNCNGKRYRCYNCKARFSVILKGRFYEIGRYALVHSHDFHLGNPWLYAPNRRLTSEQESAIRILMSTFRNTKELQRLIASQYGLQVNRFDLLNIRRRPHNAHYDELIEVMPPTPQRVAPRQQVDEQDIKVHASREVMADFPSQHISYGTQNVRTEIAQLTQPVPQTSAQRRYGNERSTEADESQEAPANTAAHLGGYGTQIVRTEIADLTPSLSHDPAQEKRGNERAAKVRESQEVLADIATHLCSYDTQNFRNMLDALKTLRNVMSMEADITLYCSTPKCSIPLPLNNNTDLKKLKGVHCYGSAAQHYLYTLRSYNYVSKIPFTQILPSRNSTAGTAKATLE